VTKILVTSGGETDFAVLDFPQLYQKPSAHHLLVALSLLKRHPRSWKNTSEDVSSNPSINIDPKGVTQYLTSIVASSLKWIRSDEEKEQIWEEASLRLSERSGRSAMPAMTRPFDIPSRNGPTNISIHEPALTADNLGLKTWASSYVLAQKLLNIDMESAFARCGRRVLELGAGTGLVGIAAAITLTAAVCLTDLPEIRPNLERNVDLNSTPIRVAGGSATTGILDWTCPETLNYSTSGAICPSTRSKFPVILAADSIYSSEHPKLLVNAISTWLSRVPEARIAIELPRRAGYEQELTDFRMLMSEAGLILVEESEDTGYDDWGSEDGENSNGEVHCWFSLWTWVT
jgi:predicted nicotinamide N-methyase